MDGCSYMSERSRRFQIHNSTNHNNCHCLSGQGDIFVLRICDEEWVGAFQEHFLSLWVSSVEALLGLIG